MIRPLSTALVAAMTMTASQGCPSQPQTPDAGGDAGPPSIVDASSPLDAAAPVDAAPPIADASTPSVAACANLAAIGCVEGTLASCATTIDHIAASRITTPLDVPCLTAAKTKAAARACGKAISCP